MVVDVWRHFYLHREPLLLFCVEVCLAFSFGSFFFECFSGLRGRSNTHRAVPERLREREREWETPPKGREKKASAFALVESAVSGEQHVDAVHSRAHALSPISNRVETSSTIVCLKKTLRNFGEIFFLSSWSLCGMADYAIWKKENNNQRSFGCRDLNASERTRRELPSAGFDLSLGKKTKKRIKELTMVNVRCQACQVKYRLLAAKRLNLLGLALEARPQKPTPRFPYRPPIQRRPRSYIIQPASLVYLKNTHKSQLSIFLLFV
jgi:hypothetical protein